MSEPHLSYSVNVVAVHSTCQWLCWKKHVLLRAVNEHTHSRDSSRVSTNRSNHLDTQMRHRAFSLEFRLHLKISPVSCLTHAAALFLKNANPSHAVYSSKVSYSSHRVAVDCSVDLLADISVLIF